MIIDTHAHAYFESLATREDELLAAMHAAGVERAMQIAVDAATSRTVVAMARRRPGVFHAVVGIHPSDCQHLPDIDAAMTEIRDIALSARDVVVALGETGLDRHYPETGSREFIRQREFFARHTVLARELGLPLVVHSRDAWDETIECLAEFQPERAVMHCYLGDYDTAVRVLGACPGAMFAFGGATTYRRNDHVRDAAARLPLDRLLVETDAPFLAPEPLRGQVNEPAHIRHTLEAIKKLRPESGEEVEDAVYRNSLEFFGL